MKNVYAYIRVSTPKQGEKGSSLQEQRAAIEAYARKGDLAISQWFEEIETAAKRGRRAFACMVSALEKGKADGVILHKIDRGARNLWDWASLQNVVDKGCEVHFAHESLDLRSRGGRLSADIQAVVAADYIRNLKDEVRKGIDGRLRQGLYPFRAPLGYRDMGKGGKRKELDLGVGPLVRRAFELYATGAYSFDTLPDELYRQGLRNRRGGAVSKSGLTTILNNPFYIGLIHIRRRGQTYEGIHEPLISKSLFDRVQALLRRKTHTKAINHDFLFRRRIACAHCGRTLSGEHQKGHVYYRCHSSSCPKTAVREEVVDEAVRTALRPVRFAEGELQELRTMIERLKAEWSTKRDEQLSALKLSLGQLGERLQRLTDAYIDRLIDRETFEARKDALLLDRKSYQERMALLAADDQTVPNQVTRFFELAQSALLSYETGDATGKRDIVKSTTSNLTVIKKDVVVELRKPFCEVVKRHIAAYCDPNRDRVRTNLKSVFDAVFHHFTTSV